MAKKILIVDDDAVIVQGMQTAFELAGYAVECMTTGRRTKDMIVALKPDIIFLDVMLDGLDGRDIAREIKADKNTAHVPIIIISASHDIKNTVFECGANDFMSKPFSVNDLVEKVEYHVPTSALASMPVGIEK